jgi:hypothetical protein
MKDWVLDLGFDAVIADSTDAPQQWVFAEAKSNSIGPLLRARQAIRKKLKAVDTEDRAASAWTKQFLVVCEGNHDVEKSWASLLTNKRLPELDDCDAVKFYKRIAALRSRLSESISVQRSWHLLHGAHPPRFFGVPTHLKNSKTGWRPAPAS